MVYSKNGYIQSYNKTGMLFRFVYYSFMRPFSITMLCRFVQVWVDEVIQ